jgi:hypothetical protein
MTAVYDEEGNELWVRFEDAAPYDLAQDLVVDGKGKITLTGYSCEGSLDKLKSCAGRTIQYDLEGNRLWTVTERSGTGMYPSLISADEEGNVYTAGATSRPILEVRETDQTEDDSDDSDPGEPGDAGDDSDRDIVFGDPDDGGCCCGI